MVLFHRLHAINYESSTVALTSIFSEILILSPNYQNLKRSLVPDTSQSGLSIIHVVVVSMISLHAKLKMPSFKHSKNMKENPKRKIRLS